MVPIVKEHVTQQGAQIVEEIPANHQMLVQQAEGRLHILGIALDFVGIL